jgi:hypothetical protein
MVGDGGYGGGCGGSDYEPFCGSFEAHEECSAVGGGYGGVPFSL